MRNTLEGFPLSPKSQIEFLNELKKLGGEHRMVACHYNSEKGTAHLHQLMHSLSNNGDIDVTHSTGNHRDHSNQTLFLLRLNATGVIRLETFSHNLITRTVAWISCAIALFSLFVAFGAFYRA